MRHLTLVVVFAVAAAAGGMARAESGLALAPGEPAPQLLGVELTTGEARLVDWSANRFTLINFWATWCVPCQEEMPALQKLWEKHGADGLGVFGVHRQQEITDRQVVEFTKTFGVRYPILRAGTRHATGWRSISALPASFLVDSKGIVRRRYVGATTEQVAGLARDVEDLLAGRPLQEQIIPEAPRFVTPDERDPDQAP